MSAPTPDNIHATLVAVGPHGILITGPARSGKSSLALSLVRAAARDGLEAALVADDRVLLEKRGERLFGRAPAALSGLLEVSGVGLLRHPVRAEAAIDLVATLEETPERLPQDSLTQLLDTPLRRIQLPYCQAPFCADILLTLLALPDDALQNF